MSYQYTQEEGDAGRVLWGRVAFLGGALLVAFLLGRLTGSDGVPAAQVQERDQRIEQLADEADGLRRQVEALQAGAPADTDEAPGQAGADTAIADARGDAPDRPDAKASQAPAPKQGQEQQDQDQGQPAADTYQVQSDDTLYTIAERVYGDGNQWTRIAQANNLDGNQPLNVGQDLQIPRAQ
jgi:nucleoid-associated protein YgaU